MIAGAEQLERRIAEHAHWRQAEAVREGRQSARDPDAARLIALGDGIRIYGPEPGTELNPAAGFEKRLVDGWWRVLPAA